MFIYLDVSGGNPTLEIEPVLSDVYGKEFTLLTGTLSLGEHNSYFDTVNSLIFSVEVPTGDEAPENSSEGIGFATIEGNPISGYLTVNGFVPNSLIDKNVHLLIIGEKYGANVMYVVDNTVTMVEGINIDLSNDTFTPLLQYAVLYSGYEGQGFANFNGSTGTLEIIIEDEPIPMGSGAINEVDLGVPPYYAAIIPIFSLTSDTYSFAFTGGWGRAETQLNVYEATTFIMVEFQ
ncbi:MAG TPA: hypothetical protein GXZ47_09355, partial [Treponema sp.]|nr:hypothetical protein [Treponema sp.]